MEKKLYVKPEAELIVFYSEEELASMNVIGGDNDGIDGSATPGELSKPEAPGGWT